MTDRSSATVTYDQPVDHEFAARSQLREFMRFCEHRYGREFADHAAFHRFSVEDFRGFWSALLDWSGIRYGGSPDVVCDSAAVESAAFFPDLRLNYVENLLVGHSDRDDRPAVIARRADGTRVEITRRELRRQVGAVAMAFRRDGLGPGDRVVAVSSNSDRLVVAGLAALAVGATLSTAAPDMGIDSVLSRFAQLAPTMLMYEAGGDERSDTRQRIGAVVEGLPTLRRLMVLDRPDDPADTAIPTDTLDAALKAGLGADIRWPRLPFAHPLFILFSSGTTGPPKCIVHSAGGTLLEHVKEHRLHGDLRPDDVLYFHTSSAWMMWNWQLSALAVGSAIVLNAEPVAEPAALWSVVAAEQVSVFGTSPAYLRLCEVEGFSPRAVYTFDRLRLLMSTGAVLTDSQFDWVAEHVGQLPIHSISGGTDIVGCFVLGAPDLPIRRGETQCRSLGLDVRAIDVDTSTGIGELVCCTPFPSRPTGLYGDPDGSRFHKAYFAANEGVWTHGDLIEITERGSVRMHGRSDSVLNIDGIRIGPAEIYAIVNEIAGVAESLVVEQRIGGGPETTRLVLLVVMTEPGSLDAITAATIRRRLGERATAHHVPRIVAEVAELPRTFSGKLSESAVRDTLNGVAVRNTEALRNPQALPAIAESVRRADAQAVEPMTTAPSDSLTARLCAVFAEVVQIAEVAASDSFFDVGGTSLLLATLRRAIYDRLGHDVPLSTLFRAPRPDLLARLIEGDGAGPDDRLVLLRPGEGAPVFAIFDGMGDVLGYRPLADVLTTTRPVYGIRARGLDGRTPPDGSIDDMVASTLEVLNGVAPDGPATILGYSFGGTVAYELARARRLLGHDDALVLIDAYLDARNHGRVTGRWHYLALRAMRWLTGWFGPRWKDSARSVRTRVDQVLPPGLRATDAADLPTPAAAAVAAHIAEVSRHYRPRTYDGDVTLLMARQRFDVNLDPLPIWRGAVRGRFCVVWAVGDHASVIGDALASGAAGEIDRLLDEHPRLADVPA